MDSESDRVQVNSLATLDDYLSTRDCSENEVYFSSIPQVCKDFPCVLGIDEAGRGPVLGPMVYGTAFCPINKMVELDNLGCADSKALTEEKRDDIFENICKSSKFVGWGVEIVSPNGISNNMLSRTKYSLNKISMDCAVGLIKGAVAAGVKIGHIYVDTVGLPEKYQEYLLRIFPNYEITVAKKADSTYPIVSAASICAKVTRDHAMQNWIFPEGFDIRANECGSGYPADPVTKRFLIDKCNPVFGYPQLVRFSWSTAEKAMEENAYHVEWEDIEEESAKPVNNTSITSFFGPAKGKGVGKHVRHEFFNNRCLNVTSDLN